MMANMSFGGRFIITEIEKQIVKMRMKQVWECLGVA